MRAVLAVVMAALCFSTTGTARALADVDASPLAIGAARILIGGGLLGLLALTSRSRVVRPLSPDPAKVAGLLGSQGSSRAHRWPSWTFVALGATGVLAYQPAFFLGTGLNGVAVGTVVALGSTPVLTGVIGGVVQRRLPSTRWMVATALAIAGVVLVSGLLSPSASGGVQPLGVLASVAAGASYAVSTLATKALLSRSWSSSDAIGAVFGTAATVSLPVLLIGGTSWLAGPNGLLLALWLGLVTTVLAYTLFGWGLARLPATTVATMSLAEPLSATLLGVLVLGERLTIASGAGLLIVAAGLALLAVPSRTEAADVPAPA